MGEGSNNDTMSSRGNGTARSMNASSARRPATAPSPGTAAAPSQRTSNSAIRQRVAEKKKLVEAQFLGRNTSAKARRGPRSNCVNNFEY
jgi:hypothetical protein